MIHCLCNATSIGETSLKERINEHLSSIKRNNLTSPVARHFMKNIAAYLYFLQALKPLSPVKEVVI